MKVLVLGVGYVGMALLPYLKERGDEIYVTTTRQERIADLQSLADHVLWLKDENRDGLKECVEACDAIVILVAPKNSLKYEETYLDMAKYVVSALEGRKRPYYLLYTSSTSVYRGLENEWATEDLECDPQEENGKILVKTEKVYLGVKDSCILRLGGIYGPERELGKRAKYFSGKEMEGGETVTNHIHRDDIVSAIGFCLETGLKGIYNLVNDDHQTRKQLYTELCERSGLPLPVWKISPDINRGIKVSNQKIIQAGYRLIQPKLVYETTAGLEKSL